jgi:hypothetical protein
MTTNRPVPVRFPPPPDKMPLKLRVLLAAAELLPGVISEHRAATLRWLRNNVKAPRRCPCGADGTVTVGMSDGWVGDTPPIFWRCDAHADIALTIPWSGGQPLINQLPSECSWKTSMISSGLVTDCGCGTHVGTQISAIRRARLER